MYKTISKLIPKKLRESYIELLKYSGMKIDPENFLGFIILVGIGLGLGIAFYPAAAYNLNYFLMAIVIFIVIELLFFSSLILKADQKSKFVESILPDFLQLMSSNLRAGMTTDKALLLSAREEFGPFQEEINRLGKEINTGKEIDIALMDLSKRIKSDKLEKTVLLLVNGIKSGGELADLLDQTAGNLRAQKIVEERIRSNVLMYVIFIFIAVCVGAPMLFGLSTYLVEVLTKNISQIDIPTELSATQQLPFNVSGVSVPMDFIIGYAIVSIIITGILGSIVIGLISRGKAKYGFRYIPIILIISLILFFIVRKAVGALLGGVFGLT
jgi:archaeal flagellar protein FlaJ